MVIDRKDTRVLAGKDRKVYELLRRQRKRLAGCDGYHSGAFDTLKIEDKQLFDLIADEYKRQKNTIQLTAAENQCSQAVLAALGSVIQNKTAEGLPGDRCHGGCEVIDKIEVLAVERAKEAFAAQYANVQPHSGTQANQIVLSAILNRDDKILSMSLADGGHYSHGSSQSLTGKLFSVSNYSVDKKSSLLDYDSIRAKALEVKPKLIICGASAYPRAIDFAKFRAIADEVDAYLLADISHISALVIAGAHRSPINYAHFTTTSTYKPGGPRGGLILMGKDYNKTLNANPLFQLIDKAVFPGIQGTPYLNHIAAKAVFFKESLSDDYRQRQFKTIENASTLADALTELGFDIITAGTDTHMVLVDVASFKQGLAGPIAQRCLEDCGIVADKITLPTGSCGLRFGTATVTKNGMGPDGIRTIATLIAKTLKQIILTGDNEYESPDSKIKNEVKKLCRGFS